MTYAVPYQPVTDPSLYIAGQVSLDIQPQSIQPWRCPCDQLDYFETALQNSAVMPAGVRLSLMSDTSSLLLEADCPRFGGDLPEERTFDLLVDGHIHQRIRQATHQTEFRFTDIPEGEHHLEVYFDHSAPARLTRVGLDSDCQICPWIDRRPKWLVYGSSNTFCSSLRIHGPSEAWPAIVAQQFGLNHTNLGYGGNCHLEPMVARMIRDTHADYISMCLGINVMLGNSLNERTFRAAVLGMIQIVREKHPETPMVIVSPLCSPPREDTPNQVGMTLRRMRETIAQAVSVCRDDGDKHLHYQDGLELFGPEMVPYMPDQLHPNADGQRVLAQHYGELVMPKLGL